MSQELDYISDLNDKYGAFDNELARNLKSIAKTEHLLQINTSREDERNKPENSDFSLKTATRRNFEMLKSLETSKARLRSRATFSPLETILQKAIGNYVKETSLAPCVTKKAYGPTYV